MLTLYSTLRRLAASICLLAGLGAPPAAAVPKHEAPLPPATVALMAARGTHAGAPIVMRIYKLEAELEVWKRARGGRYVHLKTFPICRWSGQLGPKTRQGDRQAPEGFYTVTQKSMNPNSAYHLSFDLGYPNAFDRARGGTGSALMVHGACSSMGCYAMTDPAISEIYALAREAFKGGQRAIQVQAYPFRMTARAMARHRSDPNIAFWRQLKEGSDRFEATGDEPVVTVTAGRYVFPPFADPAKEALAAARRSEEDLRIAALVAEGIASVRTTYADGGMHPSFRRGFTGEVSRPESLAFAGREVIVIPARPKAKPAEIVLAATAPRAAEALPATASAIVAIGSPAAQPRAVVSALLFTPAPFGATPPLAPAAIPGSPAILATSLAAAPPRVVAQR